MQDISKSQANTKWAAIDENTKTVGDDDARKNLTVLLRKIEIVCKLQSNEQYTPNR